MIGLWRKKLKSLILARKTVDQLINEQETMRKELNAKIIGILVAHKRKDIRLAGYDTVIVEAMRMELDEKGILGYYKKHDIIPPIKQVFDPAMLEQDIKDKVVPASILRKYSTVKPGTPYVRMTKVK